MNGDIQITVTGSSSADLPPTLLTHIDMLAGTLYGTPGWAIRVDIDPGIVLVATPARETEPPGWYIHGPVRPPEAPLSPEPASSVGTDAPNPLDGRTA